MVIFTKLINKHMSSENHKNPILDHLFPKDSSPIPGLLMLAGTVAVGVIGVIQVASLLFKTTTERPLEKITKPLLSKLT
jgi:hypothetical protein